MNNYIAYFSEYIGTFFFILSIFVSGGNPLIIGGALAIAIFFVANSSGGHLNPAVSLAMYMNGTISSIKLYYYILAQFLGGISAYYVYHMAR